MRLFYEAVSGLLGIVLLVVFIAAVIGFSAAITWVVVKVSPSKSGKQRRGNDSAAA
jgi:uncharacterized BrkB/YihY/UPF0761 family membrane protein